MGKKKKKQQYEPPKPQCYFCEREFQDEQVLLQHQKAKHFKCEECHKKLNSIGGLRTHVRNLHKRELNEVPNAVEHKRKEVNAETMIHQIPDNTKQAQPNPPSTTLSSGPAMPGPLPARPPQMAPPKMPPAAPPVPPQAAPAGPWPTPPPPMAPQQPPAMPVSTPPPSQAQQPPMPTSGPFMQGGQGPPPTQVQMPPWRLEMPKPWRKDREGQQEQRREEKQQSGQENEQAEEQKQREAPQEQSGAWRQVRLVWEEEDVSPEERRAELPRHRAAVAG